MDTNTEQHHLLHSFCVNPAVTFESQLPGEKIILVLRAHPVTQLHWIINSLLLLILLVILDLFLPNLVEFTLPQTIFMNVFGLAFVLAYIWFNFLMWFFNVGVVTDQRVIDIHFVNVLYKEVTATKLDKVEEVTSRGGGYLASLFDYGNVSVETLSTEGGNLEFENVLHPAKVVEVINQLMQ